MLRVAYTTADAHAVGDYRVRFPVEELGRQGKIEATITDLKLKAHAPNGVTEVLGLETVPDADVLIIQRPTNRWLVDAIPMYQAEGIAVVVDLDDDIERMITEHGHFRIYHPRTNPDENWEHLKRACRIADMLIVSTPELCRYGSSHGRVAMLRNGVPSWYLDVEAEREPVLTVGWGGTVMNHPYDLQVTHGGVGQAVDECEAKFLVIGDGNGVKDGLGLTWEPEHTGIILLEDYIRNLARLDVGLAPLEHNAFTRAKSWLKLIEMSAVGVPWVASAGIPEYEVAAEQFMGYLARDKARHWKRSVKELLGDDVLRTEMSLANRELAETYTYSNISGRWLEAFEEAIDHRSRVG